MTYREILKNKGLSFKQILLILDTIDKNYSDGYKGFNSNADWFKKLSDERKVEVKQKAKDRCSKSIESAEELIDELINRYQEICHEEQVPDDVKTDAEQSIVLIKQFGEETKEFYSLAQNEGEAITEPESYEFREQRLLTLCKLAFLEDGKGSPKEHAQKLASMFLSTKDAVKYIKANIKNNKFPIQDACLFVLPEDRDLCDFPFWRSIISENLNDKEARALLPKAPELEALIKSNAQKVSSEPDYRAIKSAKNELMDLTQQFKELKQHRGKASYEDKDRYNELVSAISKQYLKIYHLSEGLELKDMDLTTLKGVHEYYNYSESEAYKYLLEHGLTKKDFRKFLGLNRLDASKNIPDIKIDGQELGLPGTYLMKVDVQDELQAARAACFGKLTDCCQSLSGELGEPCTIHGLTSPNGGFYVVCYGDINNPTIHDELIGQSWVWRSQSGGIVFDSIEEANYHAKHMLVKYYNSLSKILVENEHTSKVACGVGSGISDKFGKSSPWFKESFIDYDKKCDSKQQRVIIDKSRPYIASKNKKVLNSFVNAILAVGNLAQNTDFIEMINYAVVEERGGIISQLKNSGNEEAIKIMDNINDYFNAVHKLSYIQQNIDSMPYLCKLMDEDRQTALMVAAEKGKIEVALKLIENGAIVNQKDDQGITALMFAALKGKTGVALKLIEKGANVNEKDNDGMTALMYAALKGKIEVALKLIENGANVNEKNEYGMTPLMVAAWYGKTEVAHILIEHGANVNEKDNAGMTPLMRAIQRGQTEVALGLIEHGADLNEKDDEGMTALMHAADTDETQVAFTLIENGANVNVKDNTGMTALMHAVNNTDETDIALKLIENDANVNEKDRNGLTPLIFAVWRSHTDVALKLIEHGADVNEKDDEGMTALMHGADTGEIEIALNLIENGANVNEKDDKGMTALMHAADIGATKYALNLVEHGADVNEKDREGKTIYDFASSKMKVKLDFTLEKMTQSSKEAKKGVEEETKSSKSTRPKRRF